MDSLGDYIYLIVIVIAALSSILKKKKKVPESERELPEAFPDFPDLDDVIPEPEVRPVPRPVYVAPTPPPPPPVQSVSQPPVQRTAFEKIASYENTNDMSKLRAKMSIKPNKEFVSMEVEKDDSPVFEIQLDSVEEAKRAFVYAEIFNRKY
jgi:type IV secretory pathway VirB10-like protein